MEQMQWFEQAGGFDLIGCSVGEQYLGPKAWLIDVLARWPKESQGSLKVRIETY